MHTNHQIPEKNLLQHESLEQSPRFIVLGAWEASDPMVTAQTRRIYGQCGLLFESLMGPGRKIDSIEDEAQVETTLVGTTARLSIVADARHQKPSLYGRMLSPTAGEIGLPAKETDLKKPCHTAFSARLREAYDRDYEKAAIVIYGGKALSWWWKRASFTGLDSRSVTLMSF